MITKTIVAARHCRWHSVASWWDRAGPPNWSAPIPIGR